MGPETSIAAHGWTARRIRNSGVFRTPGQGGCLEARRNAADDWRTETVCGNHSYGWRRLLDKQDVGGGDQLLPRSHRPHGPPCIAGLASVGRLWNASSTTAARGFVPGKPQPRVARNSQSGGYGQRVRRPQVSMLGPPADSSARSSGRGSEAREWCGSTIRWIYVGVASGPVRKERRIRIDGRPSETPISVKRSHATRMAISEACRSRPASKTTPSSARFRRRGGPGWPTMRALKMRLLSKSTRTTVWSAVAGPPAALVLWGIQRIAMRADRKKYLHLCKTDKKLNRQ